MRPQPFMFNCGEQSDGTVVYAYNGYTLELTTEDVDNFKENGLDDGTIVAMSFSYLTKRMFADFSDAPIIINENGERVEVEVIDEYEL